jgi:thioredoxin reductase
MNDTKKEDLKRVRGSQTIAGGVLASGAVAYDVVLIGDTLCSVLTAFKLHEAGLRVTWVDGSGEGAGLSSLLEVSPTIMNSETLSGEAFAGLVHDRAAAVGIDRMRQVSSVCLSPSEEKLAELSVSLPTEERLYSKFVVFCGAGADPGLSHLPEWRMFMQRGVSADAWSDAGCYRDRPVIVFGDSRRAAEQALIAHHRGARPILICPYDSFNSGGLSSRLAVADIDVRTALQLVRLDADAKGGLRSVGVRRASGREFTIEVACVFLAQRLIPDWSLFGGETASVTCPRFILSGVAAGVEYWDHKAQVEESKALVRMLSCQFEVSA